MNRASRKRSLKANRQDGDATLRDSGLVLSDIVTLKDSGQLDSLLPPITAGTCGWCRGSGLVRDLNGLLCQTCISMAFELIRAAVADDANAYAVLEQKIDSRKRITRETIH